MVADGACIWGVRLGEAADLQPAGARHYCAGTLAVISAAVITSWTADAFPWLYSCF
jgi:hypothetical protein